jgi:hypothetical protein
MVENLIWSFYILCCSFEQLSFYSQVPGVVPTLKPSLVLALETDIHALVESYLVVFFLVPFVQKKSQWKVILLKKVSKVQCNNKQSKNVFYSLRLRVYRPCTIAKPKLPAKMLLANCSFKDSITTLVCLNVEFACSQWGLKIGNFVN